METSRLYTNKLLEKVEFGEISADEALIAALKYMSEDDVKDMCKANEFICDSDFIKEESDDNDFEEDKDLADDMEIYLKAIQKY